ncbi:MAG: hypothetical protein AMXMBFR48_11360 [Ignavibacteriales bacterium]
MNILDINGHSENFYQYLLNEIYGWKLENENLNIQNVESIDLIDKNNKYIVQVSSVATKSKIENSLSKDSIKKYKDYTFKFISISKDADNLRKDLFANPNKINFIPVSDIIDKKSILASINNLDITVMERVYELIKNELGNKIYPDKLETNLAKIISILSKENLDIDESFAETKSYEIERKISFNNLRNSNKIINEHKVHYGRIDRIYSEFDTQGYNKSRSVLSSINFEYIKAKSQLTDDSLFVEVISKVKDKVINSQNYVNMAEEELELCVLLIVVDAFIRCKIFENPENYDYATT